MLFTCVFFCRLFCNVFWDLFSIVCACLGRFNCLGSSGDSFLFIVVFKCVGRFLFHLVVWTCF